MLEELFARVACRPVLVPAVAGPVMPDTDAMFAARRQGGDDYDDYDEPRSRRGGVGERAARRTSGVGARRKSNDTLKIVGIVVAILIGVGLVALIKPSSDVTFSGGDQAPTFLWSLGRTVFEWKQKFSNDDPKLFPPGQDHWFTELFTKDFTEYKLNVSKGFIYYYSVSPDRTKFVVAGAPENAGGWDKCYCVVQDGPEADRKIFEAIWKSPSDMLPPENGNMPVTSNGWSQIEPPKKKIE